MTERDLLEALTVDDPWCTSTEGLDDGCHFCGEWRQRFEGDRPIRYHEEDCDWMAAMEYLGRDRSGHGFYGSNK